MYIKFVNYILMERHYLNLHNYYHYSLHIVIYQLIDYLFSYSYFLNFHTNYYYHHHLHILMDNIHLDFNYYFIY
jgi:hypothetical protein